jgi:acetylornithine aminotransferase
MDCSYLSAFGYGQIAETNTDLISIPMDQPNAVSQLNFNEIAVFVLEPGNAWGFIRYPAPEFVKSIADGISNHGGLLMANEVTTGFGRTGKWFGFQYYDYNPDIVSVGKALGNGYPVSGVAISPKVAELFRNNPFRYAQSHQNDALGCAVGLEVIRTMEREDMITQSYEKGMYFKQELIHLQAKYHHAITDIRARGLMIGMDLVSLKKADILYNQLIDHGFLVGLKEKTIRFMPPLIVEKQQIDKLIETTDGLLSAMNF